MRAEQSIGRLVREELPEPVGVAHRRRAAVRGEREFAELRPAGGFQLLLGQADPGDFGPGVDEPGNEPSYMTRLARKRSGESTPSSSALCASIGPAMTSPIA